MDQVIRGMHKFASAYLDDLIILSTTWEDHLTHLRAVLSQLQELRLTTKPSKCQFAMTRVYVPGSRGGEWSSQTRGG